ncbi:MAG: excinuclease ABC subunit UvrC, partial [Nitrospinae bacterium]|nr:excinuclease ABC subunit UvrC [Nitrospinota bacterium]
RFGHLKETLENLPSSPGVYQMKDENGKVLYVGKALYLRSRVRSYFQESAEHTPRIALMVEKVRNIDLVVTASELEALILEDNLIKKLRPRYNVLLKDDKNYPYLKLTTNESFPRLILVRRVEDDGCLYFGPYVSGKAVRSTMRLIHNIFPLRQSRDNLDGKPFRRPCLNYQMKRCLAPCAGLVTREEYMQLVNEVALFLKGRNSELIGTLTQRMMTASDSERFESAAMLRDQISSIQQLAEKQRITSANMEDEDVIASHEEAGKAIIKIFQVRAGKLNGDRGFMFDRLEKADRAEALSAFVRQFYSDGMEIPPEILVSDEPEDRETLEERLSAMRGTKVRIAVPSRGRKRELIEMARRNAKFSLDAHLNTARSRDEALAEIKNLLGLPRIPDVIEGYDISNTSGVSSVGAVVVFRGGVPAKDDYRKYRIKSVAGPDDYASLAEVLERRFTKLKEAGEIFDGLLVIDGGKGQVSAAAAKFKEIGVDAPPMVGIAKGEDRENPETDEFYTPGSTKPVAFPPSSPGRFLLQQVRDEAHRFAVAYHRKLRGASSIESSLDRVSGLGPKRKKLLLTKFGSVKRARSASMAEIMEALSVSEKVAKKILESL